MDKYNIHVKAAFAYVKKRRKEMDDRKNTVKKINEQNPFQGPKSASKKRLFYISMSRMVCVRCKSYLNYIYTPAVMSYEGDIAI